MMVVSHQNQGGKVWTNSWCYLTVINVFHQRLFSPILGLFILDQDNSVIASLPVASNKISSYLHLYEGVGRSLIQQELVFNSTSKSSILCPVWCLMNLSRSDLWFKAEMSAQNIRLRPPWECWQAARDSWTPGGWREGEVRLSTGIVWCVKCDANFNLGHWKYCTTTQDSLTNQILNLSKSLPPLADGVHFLVAKRHHRKKVQVCVVASFLDRLKSVSASDTELRATVKLSYF